MQAVNCSEISCFEVAVDMMNLYGHFFLIANYLKSSDTRARSVREQLFEESVLSNFAELEHDYQNRLSVCFGEHPNVNPMCPMVRPKLKYQITLMNAWTHFFEAFGSVDVFLAGLGIRTDRNHAVNRHDFWQAKNRILCATRNLQQDCLSFIEASHMAEGTLMEYARAVLLGIDVDRLFE